MTKNWKALGLMAITLTVVLALLLAACAPAKPVMDEKAIKVGLSVMMTGPIASLGVPWSEGLIDYLRYVNDELGGIEYRSPDGKTEKARLHIMWEDNAYNVPKDISIHKRQKAAGVMLRILNSSTGTEALAPTLSRERIPYITNSASPLTFAPKPIYGTAGWFHYSDLLGSIFLWMVKESKEARPVRVALMVIDVTTARVAHADLTAEKVARLGAELVGWEWVPAAVTDSTIELSRLMREKPDYIISVHVPGSTSVMIKDAVRLGIRDEVGWAVQHVGTDESTIGLLGELAEGVYFQTVTSWPVEDDLSGVEFAHSIIRKYRGHDASNANINTMYLSMAAVEGLRIALEKVGYEGLTGEAINDALHSIKGLDTGGIVPLVNVDPNYPVLNTHTKMAVARGGRFVPVGGWLECPELATRPE